MTRKDFFELAGYFANPARGTRIELEARKSTINNYGPTYLTKTGSQLPIGSDSITSLDENANKWGREMRIYFVCADPTTIPNTIGVLMTDCNRPGYKKWNKRLNSRSIIDDLLSIGFTLGEPQNETNIQGHISQNDLNDFNSGYNV